MTWIAGDLDPGTVLIHLPVAGEVEPGPREQDRVRGRGEAGNGEVVHQRDGTPTDHRLDDFEGFSIVIRQGQLAGASVVRYRPCDGHVVRVSCIVGGLGHIRLVVRVRRLVVFAGEVGPVGQKGRSHGIVLVVVGNGRVQRASERVGPTHLHVRVSEEGETC